MPVDSSIANVDLAASAAAAAAAAAGSPAPTGTPKPVDLAELMQMRKDDWAFHFFKQNEGTKLGAILPPSKCKQVDNVNVFSFVRAWWFDNK